MVEGDSVKDGHLSLEKLDIFSAMRARRHKSGRMAFVSGNFNILHPGHLRLLRFAADSADFLVVGVTMDGAPGVTIPQQDRLDGVRALALVDETLLLEEPVIDVIAKLQPDIVVKGKEYEVRENIEQDAVKAYGGKLLFSSGEMQFSSAHLLAGELLPVSSIRKPDDYRARHGFDLSDLKALITGIAGLRVLVIGDLIIDTYIDCDPLGMSQEDPTLVVAPIEERTFLGGAGIVAAHARGLGGEARFLSVIGGDPEADFARTALTDFGIEATLLVDSTRPTTLKRRYRAKGKTLLRVNRLRQHAIDPELSARMVAEAVRLLDQTDVLLFSDFNYGCLPQQVVDALIKEAKARGIVVCADSQASSQLSDISRYKGMDLVTPTEREARLALRDFEGGLVIVAEDLQKRAQAKHVLITLGSEGLLTYARKEGEFRTDRLPAFNTAPKDAAGAGDSLFISMAMALGSGADIWRSTYLGALAAACQVSRVGNIPLTSAELLAELDHRES
jgi:rfaE bifunctional protein kinase chain/domain